MLTYYKLLQIHAKTPSIILPTETFTFCSGVWTDKITENNDNQIVFQIYFIISGLYSFQKNYSSNIFDSVFQGRTSQKMEQWVHHKYNVAFKAVIMNSFLSDHLKEEIFVIIEKTQRSYFALKRFLHICRLKNTKIKIDTDLCLNPIDPMKAFTIVQNGCKYLFTVPDILNLTMAALMNAQDFFAEPRFPKNPYTNVSFTKTDMYNIYFRVVESRLITPPLFTECFLCHFELDNFLIDNETKLRNLSIKNYVLNSPHTILYSEVMFMIRIFFRGNHNIVRRTRIPKTRGNGARIITSTVRISIDIHPDFPRDVLVDVMRPYLYLYLLFHDHIRGTEKKTIAKTILKNEVQRFMKFNPKFGRKQINTSYQNHGNPFDLDSQNRVLTSSFNDRHEIFTVQRADEMFTTKVILQKNDEISVIESESSDDDSVTESVVFQNSPVTSSNSSSLSSSAATSGVRLGPNNSTRVEIPEGSLTGLRPSLLVTSSTPSVYEESTHSDFVVGDLQSPDHSLNSNSSGTEGRSPVRDSSGVSTLVELFDNSGNETYYMDYFSVLPYNSDNESTGYDSN